MLFRLQSGRRGEVDIVMVIPKNNKFLGSVMRQSRAVRLGIGILGAFVLLNSGFARELSAMTREQFDALTDEQRKAVPFLEMVDSVGPGMKQLFLFSIEECLYELRFYPVLPSGNESDELTAAIRQFQISINAEPTGKLLNDQFESLKKRCELRRPDEIFPRAGKYIKGDRKSVVATGTWVFLEGEHGCPINVSQISCTRDDMKCRDHAAQICIHGLDVIDEDYRVTKWTDIELVAENDTPRCVAYTLSINFQKEEALIFRRAKGGEGCEIFAQKPQIVRKRLGNYTAAVASGRGSGDNF
jgi:hypothetical protein